MKNIFKKIGLAIGIGIILTTMIGTELTMAQSRPPIVPAEEAILLPHPNPASGNIPAEQYFGGNLLPTITRTIIALAGASAFLFIIVGGIQILTAYGNEEKIGAGKKTIEYAIVGLLVAILSYAIVSIIGAVNLQSEMAPGSEDMTTAEMNDPGRYGPGSEPIQGGIQPKN